MCVCTYSHLTDSITIAPVVFTSHQRTDKSSDQNIFAKNLNLYYTWILLFHTSHSHGAGNVLKYY